MGINSAIDYILVHDKARGMVRELMIDKEGIFSIGSYHNAFVMKYDGKNRVKKEKEAWNTRRWRLNEADKVYFRAGMEEILWVWKSYG